MQTEVTNTQYSEFLNRLKYEPEDIGEFIGIRGYCTPLRSKHTGTRFRPSYGYEDHPVMTVSYRGAELYCETNKARLPTEMEWEIAARGGLQRGQVSLGQ